MGGAVPPSLYIWLRGCDQRKGNGSGVYEATKALLGLSRDRRRQCAEKLPRLIRCRAGSRSSVSIRCRGEAFSKQCRDREEVVVRTTNLTPTASAAEALRSGRPQLILYTTGHGSPGAGGP